MAQSISPCEAGRLIAEGAILVDVRESAEHARERVASAVLRPLSCDDAPEVVGDTLVFHCRSGMRTAANLDQLAAIAGDRRWYVLEGGLDAWRKAGFPVEVDRDRPIELQRQVMITAGLLVATGSLASLLVSPVFLAVPLFVGAGLTFAGITGFCGMARLLMLAPWNRPMSPAARAA